MRKNRKSRQTPWKRFKAAKSCGFPLSFCIQAFFFGGRWRKKLEEERKEKEKNNEENS